MSDDATPGSGAGSRQVDVVVVGGGLAGLTAANAAADAGASVLVVEAHRLGGRARTTTVHGAVFNGGPRALYLGGAAGRVLRGFGVALDGVVPPRRGYRLVRRGRLHLFPRDVLRLVGTRALSTRATAQLGALMVGLPCIDPARLAGVSVADWVDQRGLSADAADTIRAIIRLATYSDDDQLAADAAVAQLQLVLSGGVLYLHGGWQQLVDSLAARARSAGVRIAEQAPVRSMRPHAGGSWVVDLAGDPAVGIDLAGEPAVGVDLAGEPAVGVDLAGEPAVGVGVGGESVVTGRAGGESAVSGGVAAGTSEVGRAGSSTSVRARSVVLAAGGPAAVAALSPVPIDHSGLSGPVTAACLELALRRPPDVALALGVDAPTYLSVHGPPARLGEGVSVVHVQRYGARAPGPDRDELWELAQLAGVGPDDVVARRFLARMTVSGGQPTGAGGGLSGRPGAEVRGAPGVLVAGDWVGPEGLLADAAFASGVTAGRLAATRASRSEGEPRSAGRRGRVAPTVVPMREPTR